MSPATYTYTYTRTEVLVDQIDLFLLLAGVEEAPRSKVVSAVAEKWLEGVGVFVEVAGERVLEGSLAISWKLHSDHAELSVSTDLPGWENGAAPEIAILATRLRTGAADLGVGVRFWVLFVKSIRDDPILYKARCERVGVGGDLPTWKATPRSQRIPVQDLREAQVTLLDAR